MTFFINFFRMPLTVPLGRIDALFQKQPRHQKRFDPTLLPAHLKQNQNKFIREATGRRQTQYTRFTNQVFFSLFQLLSKRPFF